MRLLFSGAEQQLTPQMEKGKSLGGFMSSSSIPNERINGIFSSISGYAQKNRLNETLGFFIYNDTEDNIENLTIQQVYDSVLGINENQADFEWAIVEPTDEYQMELIGNINETPFYANFFSPTTVRESCVLKITQAPAVGGTLFFLNETVFFSGETIEDFVDQTVEVFEGNEIYTVAKYSNSSLFIERKELIETGDLVEFTGSVPIGQEPVNFSGFEDGETLIKELLEPTKAIGVWIRRKIKKAVSKDCSELKDSYEANEEVDMKECLNVFLSYDD